jgi:hypothetical protein
MNDLSVFDEAEVAAKLRAAWAESLGFAISQCHPLDASQIMTAALEQMEQGQPPHPFLALTQDDADFWAASAPQHELQAYLFAAMKVMTARAITPAIRRRVIAALWSGLSEPDRKAFIAHVSGGNP